MNTMFTKQSILGKPPSSSYKPKLYSVTPFPKSTIIPKVGKSNALSKLVNSNSAPSTRESKVVQTVNVIASNIFRTNPFKTSRVNNTVKTRKPHHRSNSNTNRVPSKSKSSCLSNNVEKIEENHRNSQSPKNQKYMSSECNNITLTIQNAKSKIVCVMRKQCLVTTNHDVCVLNYVNDMNSRVDNQSANVSKHENQKKHKVNVRKSKELRSKGSLASSRPSKPRTCHRWIPTRRIFSMCGKLTASSNTENKSNKSVCDNASTSYPSEPSSKGFLNSTSLLGSQNRRDLPKNTSLDRVEVLASKDSSKHGRIIEEIDQDVGVTLVTPTKFSSQEDQSEDHTGSSGVSTASRIVSTTGLIQRVNIIIPSASAIKDKGKAIMIESEPEKTTTKLKQRQERAGYEAAIRLQEQLDEEERQRIAMDAKEDIKARVKADKELTQKLQAVERDKYSEVDQARLLQLKRYTFDELKELFETTMKHVSTFTSIETEDRERESELAARSYKRPRAEHDEHHDKESLKK
ncbi:hypothetical protein Tco_0563605 [Tanacetum coccineum]